MLKCFLALLLLVSAVEARAARFSGDYLLQVCASDKEGKELSSGSHIACQAYLSGILDYHNLIRSLGTAPGIDFCVGDDVTLKEVQGRIVLYLLKNKHEQGPFIASPGVALGLHESYPCTKGVPINSSKSRAE